MRVPGKEQVSSNTSLTGTQITPKTVAKARVQREQHNTGGLQPDRRGNRQQRTLPTPDARQSQPMPQRPRSSGQVNPGGGERDQSDGPFPGGIVDWENLGNGGFEPPGMSQPGWGTDTTLNQPDVGNSGPEMEQPAMGNSPEEQWAMQFKAQYGAWPPGYDYLEQLDEFRHNIITGR